MHIVSASRIESSSKNGYNVCVDATRLIYVSNTHPIIHLSVPPYTLYMLMINIENSRRDWGLGEYTGKNLTPVQTRLLYDYLCNTYFNLLSSSD